MFDRVLNMPLNPIQDGGDKKAHYQFFPCNIYKRRNWPPGYLTFSFNFFTTLV